MQTPSSRLTPCDYPCCTRPAPWPIRSAFAHICTHRRRTGMAAINVCVTGAAGQIGYSLVYMIAKGDMFGPTQVWFLPSHCCETCDNFPAAHQPLPARHPPVHGVAWRPGHGAPGLLGSSPQWLVLRLSSNRAHGHKEVVATADATVAFKDCDVALLVCLLCHHSFLHSIAVCRLVPCPARKACSARTFLRPMPRFSRFRVTPSTLLPRSPSK